MAFMDIFPINTGHVLVIPKRHIVTLDDCDETVARHLISTLRIVNRAVQAATDCGGILNEIMNGEAAGQEIFHLHIHVVPRNTDDGFGWRFPKGYREHVPSRQLLDHVAGKIKTELQ
jgi:histidine triad (HIT) family protein